jgi:hypothetical protein
VRAAWPVTSPGPASPPSTPARRTRTAVSRAPASLPVAARTAPPTAPECCSQAPRTPPEPPPAASPSPSPSHLPPYPEQSCHPKHPGFHPANSVIGVGGGGAQRRPAASVSRWISRAAGRWARQSRPARPGRSPVTLCPAAAFSLSAWRPPASSRIRPTPPRPTLLPAPSVLDERAICHPVRCLNINSLGLPRHFLTGSQWRERRSRTGPVGGRPPKETGPRPASAARATAYRRPVSAWASSSLAHNLIAISASSPVRCSRSASRIAARVRVVSSSLWCGRDAGGTGPRPAAAAGSGEPARPAAGPPAAGAWRIRYGRVPAKPGRSDHLRPVPTRRSPAGSHRPGRWPRRG